MYGNTSRNDMHGNTKKPLHVHEQNQKGGAFYSLSNILLIASQPASSSPLCLFALGALLSSVFFDRSNVGRGLVALSFSVMLTPLSARAGCTGLDVATGVVAREGVTGGAGLVAGLVVAGLVVASLGVAGLVAFLTTGVVSATVLVGAGTGRILTRIGAMGSVVERP